MRAVVQRVTRARVVVAGDVVGAIDRPGLCVLVGVTHGDTARSAERLARKVSELRVLRGPAGPAGPAADAGRGSETSALDVAAPVLVVSQFTLYGDARKGRRPSWADAAPGSVAEPLVDAFAQALRGTGLEVAQGRFGAEMAVELVNDGPFTLLLEV